MDKTFKLMLLLFVSATHSSFYGAAAQETDQNGNPLSGETAQNTALNWSKEQRNLSGARLEVLFTNRRKSEATIAKKNKAAQQQAREAQARDLRNRLAAKKALEQKRALAVAAIERRQAIADQERELQRIQESSPLAQNFPSIASTIEQRTLAAQERELQGNNDPFGLLANI